MKRIIDECTVCSEILGRAEGFPSDYARLIEQERNIIAQTNNFCVLPSIGPLNEFHLIIVPKNHYTAIAQLDNVQFEELINIKQELNDFNKTVLKENTVYFEHGSCIKSHFDSSCIDHAHLHALGLSQKLIEHIKKLINLTPIEFQEIKNLSNKSYLFYEDLESNCFYNNDESMPSQFIRRIYCQLISNEMEWNWRYHPNIKRIEKILSNYQNFKL
ncbi:hypothetical protein DMA11_10550 [Marinilabiliaceae bacterium JC017]|nr:hypothetical protein DMA11_10550 [Marinilabiliaceae bacterium JC017]